MPPLTTVPCSSAAPRRRIAAGLALAVLASVGVVGSLAAPAAAAGPEVGHDISWPNCARGMGIPERPTLGLPMPEESSAYVIVGLTNGPAFTPNPCLRTQVEWVGARHKPAAAYAITTYPTPAELAAHGGDGTLLERLRRVGAAQAAFNVRNMHAAGLFSPIVWVDVEPSTARAWSADKAANNAIVDGVLAGYAAAGIQTGFYSYAYGWREIVGDRRSDLPTWVPSGSNTQASGAARCGQASFSGGRVLFGQWTVNDRDYNVTCPGVSTADPSLFTYQNGPAGAIAARYRDLGGGTSPLGVARSAELIAPDQVGRYSTFTNGSIYWTRPTGAHEVRGLVRDRWAALGWERSPLGYPVSGEHGTPGLPGRFSHFQQGSIYWTPALGAHEVRGLIRDRWSALGWERSPLGFPVTGELGTPDGQGRFSHFEHGSVYWTPATGAHEVRGRIRDHWVSLGWERSSLGFPLTGERDVPGGRAQTFQGGTATWTAATGAVTVTR